MTIEEIEAREKAAPLTDEEYAVWKGNIEAIAEMQAGEWYSLKGGGFVLAQRKPGADPEMTTTIGIQLRLFATIDSLLAQLREARAETKELAEKGYEAAVWGWSKERERLVSQLVEAKAEAAPLRAAITWALENYKLPSYIRRHLKDALSSDAGKGWIPVDLVWSYLWHQSHCAYLLRDEGCDCAFDEMMEKVKEARGCQRCP